ncbi:MAG: hypothetical protein R3E32_07555 [Chitinophagales bacterium]
MSSYYYEKLEEGYFYHIYNRGINGENIFKKEKNYLFFLKKYAQHIPPVMDTYAYCLLKNHFHLLVRIKTREEQEAYFEKYQKVLDVSPKAHKVRGKYMTYKYLDPSYQIAHLCNGYAQGINADFKSGEKKRTGGLFEKPFQRVKITTESYFVNAIYYIHRNPQKHGFVKDFREYPHSSYHSFLSKGKTQLMRKEVLDWFGGKEQYIELHNKVQELDGLEDWCIDFD